MTSEKVILVGLLSFVCVALATAAGAANIPPPRSDEWLVATGMAERKKSVEWVVRT